MGTCLHEVVCFDLVWMVISNKMSISAIHLKISRLQIFLHFFCLDLLDLGSKYCLTQVARSRALSMCAGSDMCKSVLFVQVPDFFLAYDIEA